MARPRGGLVVSGEARLTAVQRARVMRQTMTYEETILWEELRSRKLEAVKFRRQHPLSQYIVDFFAPSHRLAIEVDGPVHEQRVEYDQRRQRYLEMQGITFLRFTNEQIDEDLEGCLEKIREALRQR